MCWFGGVLIARKCMVVVNCDAREVRVLMLDTLQYQLLRRIAPNEPTTMDGGAFHGRSKLRVQLGEVAVNALIRCGVVIDFGCGSGNEAIELAQAGCRRVIGLDIQENLLQSARQAASRAGVSIEFATTTTEQANAILSLDAFEHFADPAMILRIMHGLLRPGGKVYACFGPTGFHPLGGHLFSIFPWSHLLFSERALCQWRRDLRSDGATSFAECPGGLNCITIRRFEQLVAESSFVLESIECVPIRPLRSIHNGLTREFTTAIVRAVLMQR